MKTESIGGRIVRNYHVEEEQLAVLNKYFKTAPLEKYPDAILNLVMSEAHLEVLGKSYTKPSISQRKFDKIKKRVLEKLRERYGKYINLTHFRDKGGKIEYETNFYRIYKTDRGALYGMPANSIFNKLFLTAHCLERFEERVPESIKSYFKYQLCGKYGTDPTAGDILGDLIFLSDFEYAKIDNFYYFNVAIGGIVVETIDDLYLGKTFLQEDMMEDRAIWYKPVFTEEERNNLFAFKSLKELLEHHATRINPTFVNGETVEKLLKRKGV